MSVRLFGKRRLTAAFALSFAIHGALLLSCGALGGGGRLSASGQGGLSVKLVSLDRGKETRPPVWTGESQIPSEVPSPAESNREEGEIGDPGAGGDAEESVAEGPHFLEELMMSDADAERLRELGDVDLAILVARDGKVSQIEVLRPTLGAMDYGWLAAMMANARIAPGRVDGVSVACRWVIRISAPERTDAVTG